MLLLGNTGLVKDVGKLENKCALISKPVEQSSRRVLEDRSLWGLVICKHIQRNIAYLLTLKNSKYIPDIIPLI